MTMNDVMLGIKREISYSVRSGGDELLLGCRCRHRPNNRRGDIRVIFTSFHPGRQNRPPGTSGLLPW
jgi:hypothetical protein